ncbi:MAG TPA: tyrosine--tRNA ligase [Candidatus Aenigmarchaeota archaeon]|nr:MAG: tyrosine--tRNA ligase [Candidatus Aenigmarchaeota archaeon]HDD46025.1 tyrosine--tRNA ligase [Candidatus Aenigmarchaeota archaeon]
MDIEERIEYILKPPTEEVITKNELKELLETNSKPYAYDGFEPSGLAHLGSGLLRAIKLKDMLKAGVRFKIYIADWFAWINNKMGGDLEKIKLAGEYLIEAWRACGIDTSHIEIVWASEFASDREYWKKVINIAKITTIKRILRCCTIMGRCEKEMLYTAQLFYPAMQAADPFHLGVDILQLGMDQRHATILSREVAEKLGWKKPVCVHHHLLIGLQNPERMGKEFEAKMSKSKPTNAIFIHDSAEVVKQKVMNAYCPAKIVEQNPVLEICKYIIFRKVKEMEIERPAKYGGNVSYASYEELEKDYEGGKLHPLDLKMGVARYLNVILDPIRGYFESNKRAKEIYEKVKSFCVSS